MPGEQVPLHAHGVGQLGADFSAPRAIVAPVDGARTGPSAAGDRVPCQLARHHRVVDALRGERVDEAARVARKQHAAVGSRPERPADRNQVRREVLSIRSAVQHAGADERRHEPFLQRVRPARHLALEVREQAPDADVHVVRLRKHVRVAVQSLVRVRDPEHVGPSRAQGARRRLLHHVDGESGRRPARVDAQALRDDAVDAVGGDDARRAEGPAVPRPQRHAVRVGVRLGDLESRLDAGARVDRRAHERMIELDAADEEHARIRPRHFKRRPIRSLEVQRADAMDVDARERALEPGKPWQRAQADAAAARLVARERGAIDQEGVDTGGRQRPRGHRAGRAGAGDDHRGVKHRSEGLRPCGHPDGIARGDPSPRSAPPTRSLPLAWLHKSEGLGPLITLPTSAARAASAPCPASGARSGRCVRPPR